MVGKKWLECREGLVGCWGRIGLGGREGWLDGGKDGWMVVRMVVW